MRELVALVDRHGIVAVKAALAELTSEQAARHEWYRTWHVGERQTWACEWCACVVSTPKCARTPGMTPQRVRVLSADGEWERTLRLPPCGATRRAA